MPNTQALFSRFREQVLSATQAGSSVLAYNSRLAHLEPLAEARFKKESVEQWLDNLYKTRSQNSARELVRLARKLWEYGAAKRAWSPANPFSGVRENASAASRDEFLDKHRIHKILDRAPDPETKAFWACCALAGLRQSEAAGLKCLNLDYRDSCIFSIVYLPTRGKAPGSVEIGEELRAILHDYLTPPPLAEN